MRRWIQQALLFSATLAIGVLAMRPRLWELRRELWGDEHFQTWNTLLANGFPDLLRKTATHAAPFLDFTLRKWFWYPVFGSQELGLRLPSLVYSLVSLALAAVLCRRLLRRAAPPVALAGAVLAVAWCAANASEIHYAAEARLYSAASCASLLWAGVWLDLDAPRRQEALAAASVLFLQVHYFAVTLVVAAYAFEMLAAARARRWNRVLSWAGILAALLLVTAVVNAPSLKAFVTFPRWASGGAPRLSLGGRLAGGLALYRDFFAYLELPGTAIPWCLLVVAAALRPSMGQRPAALRLGFVLFLALPVHFLLLRGATGYEFWTRYYMPFFGLGLGLVGVGMGVRPGLRASQRGDLIATTLAVILILTCIIRLERRPGSASLPPQNFSEHFRYFEALKSGGPTLVIADAGSGLTPAVYFHVVGKPIPPSLQWLSCSETDTFGCLDAIIGATDYPGCIAEATLGAFLRKYPQGKVVLYQGAGPCPPLVTQEGLRAGATGLGQASCAWSLTGITRPGEVRAFAARNGFAYP